MVKSKMRDEDKDDRDVKKDIDAVQQQLNTGDQVMQQMGFQSIV